MTEEQKQKLAKDNIDLSSTLIKLTIQEVNDEIESLRLRAENLEATPPLLPRARLDYFRVKYYRDGIRKREDFVQLLEAILEVRLRQ